MLYSLIHDSFTKQLIAYKKFENFSSKYEREFKFYPEYFGIRFEQSHLFRQIEFLQQSTRVNVRVVNKDQMFQRRR